MVGGVPKYHPPLGNVVVLSDQQQQKRRRPTYSLALTIASTLATICFLGLTLTTFLAHDHHHRYPHDEHYGMWSGGNANHAYRKHHDGHHHGHHRSDITGGGDMQHHMSMVSDKDMMHACPDSPGVPPPVCQKAKEWKKDEIECVFENEVFELECELEHMQIECELENKKEHTEIKFDCLYNPTTCMVSCPPTALQNVEQFANSATTSTTVVDILKAWRPTRH